jgi:L-aspartate oxidase
LSASRGRLDRGEGDLPSSPGLETDVLVVGGGLAGMAAALEAAAAGARVLLAEAGEGASERAQGGIAAALGEDDSPRQHALDTLAAGAGLCDPRAVRLLTEEAPGAVAWLSQLGVPFDRREGGLALALEAAHSRPRVVHAGGDRSGSAITAALRSRLGAIGAVRRVRGELAGLLVHATGVAGARLRPVDAEAGSPGDGETPTSPVDVRAGAVILASGGYAGLFARTTTSRRCDGLPLVAALLAGATLADLELVQFHPTVYAGPGEPFLVTEALRGAGATLTDRGGRRFLLDADPRGELAPRAVVTRAMVETLARSGERAVFLDARHLGACRLAQEFPGFLARCRSLGLDPTREPVPVAPAAHYTMGGIVTDLEGRTGVPGLFAAGECARTGVHGANRLASNSLLEAVVFGRRAGRAAAEAASPPPPAGATCREVRAEDTADVRRLLERCAGPQRHPEQLRRGLEELGESERDRGTRTLARLVLASALLRAESRGAHVRTDRPEEDPAWAGLEVGARWTDSGPSLEVRPRRPGRRPGRSSPGTGTLPLEGPGERRPQPRPGGDTAGEGSGEGRP